MSQVTRAALWGVTFLTFIVYRMAEWSSEFGAYAESALFVLTVLFFTCNFALLARDLRYVHARVKAGRVFFWLSVIMGFVLIAGEVMSLVSQQH